MPTNLSTTSKIHPTTQTDQYSAQPMLNNWNEQMNDIDSN